MPTLSRRSFLIASATASAAACSRVPNTLPPEYPEQTRNDAPVFLDAAERRFINAACARIIPKDELGPGALEAGVPDFIDRQLAGPFGQGGNWYMQGPWDKGLPTQGYQTRLTPAAMYLAAIRGIDQQVARQGRAGTFAKLSPADQDSFLKSLENGQVELGGGVDARAFFDVFLQNTIEGFWSDPIYGGNRDMAGWKLIGFPGARYDYRPYVGKHGEQLHLPPVGLKGRADWTPRS